MSRLYHALAEALLLALLAAALFVLLARGGARGAPAPLPRPAKEVPSVEALTVKDLVGWHVMTWGGGDWNVSLSASGCYEATRGNGSIWAGTWQLNPDSSITVSEAWLDDNGRRGSEMTWTAVWGRDERGRLNPRRLRGVVKRPDGSTSTTVEFRRSAR